MMKRAFTLKPSALAVVAALGIGYSPVLLAAGPQSIYIDQHYPQYFIPPAHFDIVEVTQSGDVSGEVYGLFLDRGWTVQTLNNKNFISATNYSIVNQGNISELNNYGIIDNRPGSQEPSEPVYVIHNSAMGTIDRLNNYNIINAVDIYQIGKTYAIKNEGAINTILNAGGIFGNISSRSDLTIIGASVDNTRPSLGGPLGEAGILSGSLQNGPESIGNITIEAGNLNFAAGRQQLNSNVFAGAVNNQHAQLYLSNRILIAGNYNQSSDASLNIYVNEGAQTDGISMLNSGYGQLWVDGAANVDAGSSISLVSRGYNFAPGQRYVVIAATDRQGTNYHAADLNYSATGWDNTIKGDSVTDLLTGRELLVMTLGQEKDNTGAGSDNGGSNGNDNGGSGGNDNGGSNGNDNGGPDVIIKKPLPTLPNATSSLAGLKNYTGVTDAGLLNLYNASLAIGSTSEANKAGEQLSPGQTLNARTAVSTTTFDMLNVVGARVASIQTARASGGQSGIAAGDAAVDSAVWGQVFNGWVNQGSTDQMSGYKANYSGLVIGADHNITDEILLGGAVSYTSTNVKGQDNASGSNSYVNSWGLTAYASYKAQDWYSSLYATAVNQNYKTQRQIDFTGYSGIANGKFDGQQYALKGEFGYPLALTQATTLTPLATLSYSYMRQDGYTETNGNGAALRVERSSSDTLKSGLGAKLETTQSTPWGDVVPYIQVLWGHQYDSKATNVAASYAAAVNETRFVTQGSTPEKDSVDVNVGATLLQSDTTSISAYYDISAAQDYTNQSVSLRLRKTF